MSSQAFEAVIGKTLMDEPFRNALLADPDQALNDFDLSESEKSWLKQLDFETMETLAHALSLHMGRPVGT